MEYNDVEIKSMAEYIQWVDETHRFCNSDKVTFAIENVYYRGQASKDWGLSPSVFRENYNEFELFQKAKKRLFNQLSQLHYFLDKIIYLQHYGLPTRLLDISYNPLVALYFACLKHNNPSESKDGVVYYGNMRAQDDSMQIAEDIAKIVFEENNILCFLNKPSKYDNHKDEDFLHPMIVNPSYSNPRIERQKGAFIMAQLIQKDHFNEYIPFRGTLEDGLFNKSRAIIKDCNKSQILKDISSLGIDGGTLFLEPSDITKAIVMENIWRIDNIIKYE